MTFATHWYSTRSASSRSWISTSGRQRGRHRQHGRADPHNLALALHRAGVKVLGTHPENIDRAEDRSKFGALLDQLAIDQPHWFQVTNVSEAHQTVERLGGYPVLVRPSYVLSGAAMSVAHERNELLRILERAQDVSGSTPWW